MKFFRFLEVKFKVSFNGPSLDGNMEQLSRLGRYKNRSTSLVTFDEKREASSIDVPVDQDHDLASAPGDFFYARSPRIQDICKPIT